MALRAVGTTSPNPPVGAIIVKNGIILSRGWTQPKGIPHAEIHAINQIKNKKDKTNRESSKPSSLLNRTIKSKNTGFLAKQFVIRPRLRQNADIKRKCPNSLTIVS